MAVSMACTVLFENNVPQLMRFSSWRVEKQKGSYGSIMANTAVCVCVHDELTEFADAISKIYMCGVLGGGKVEIPCWMGDNYHVKDLANVSLFCLLRISHRRIKQRIQTNSRFVSHVSFKFCWILFNVCHFFILHV